MQTIGSRSPRFRRLETPPGFERTDRDLEILRVIAENRFAHAAHIANFLGMSQQMVNRRLYGLYHHGYIDRPPVQIVFHRGGGSKPTAHSITNKGYRLLLTNGLARQNRTDWNRENRDVSPLLSHTLATTSFMASLASASRAGGARLISRFEMLDAAPRATRRLSRPFAWTASFEWKGEPYSLGVEPDQIFGLDSGDGRPAYFFLEADRGTMPITRRNLRLSSVLRKMLCYATTHSSRLQAERFGIRNFRVLLTVPSRERSDHFIETFRRLRLPACPPSLFLITDTAELLTTGSPLSARWRNAVGKDCALVRRAENTR